MPSDLADRAALLRTLRLAHGLTQVDLAEVTGVSQAALSKAERGREDLEADRWATLERALAVPAGTLIDAPALPTDARIFHRRQKTTPETALKRVRAELDLVSLRTGGLLGESVPPLQLRRHPIPDDGFDTPADIAAMVRRDLNLPDGPILDLVAVAEDAGIVIVTGDLDSVQVDAIAGWPEQASPIILVARHASAERQRFTVAHELGHAVMHSAEPSPSHEREADAFASAFLMPAGSFRSDWAGSDLDALLRLKRHWRVSLAAVIRRAFDLDLIGDREYRSLNVTLATTGMRRREPEPLRVEEPHMLQRAVDDAMNRGATVSQLAHNAYMLEPEFRATFLEEQADA
jgi:Zn-dependent peptidase ImmA (M78 family)/transcriptional regulator with XRE-family HTH domain